MVKILTFCLTLLISYQCRTTEINTLDHPYSVQDFFKKKLCQEKCGVSSPCEGKKLKLVGKADIGNIFEKENRFFLADSKESKYFIVCKMNKNSEQNWAEHLKKGVELEVEGRLRSYDATTNYTCRKNYELIDVSLKFD